MRDATGNRWKRGWRLIPILFCLLMICQSAFAATKPSGALKDVEAATQDAEHGIYTLYPGMPLEEYLHNWGNIKGWTTVFEAHSQHHNNHPSLDTYDLGKSRDHDHVVIVHSKFLDKKLRDSYAMFYFRSKKEAEQAFEIADQNLRKGWGEPTLDRNHWEKPVKNDNAHSEEWIQYDQKILRGLSINLNRQQKLKYSIKVVEMKPHPIEELAKKLPYRVTIIARIDSEKNLEGWLKEAEKEKAKPKTDSKSTNSKTTTHKIH